MIIVRKSSFCIDWYPFNANSSLGKKEEVHQVKYLDYDSAKQALFQYIEGVEDIRFCTFQHIDETSFF